MEANREIKMEANREMTAREFWAKYWEGKPICGKVDIPSYAEAYHQHKLECMKTADAAKTSMPDKISNVINYIKQLQQEYAVGGWVWNVLRGLEIIIPEMLKGSTHEDLAEAFTLSNLQNQLPWTVKYSEDFRKNPQSHKDFAHAVVHTQKALGRLAEYVDDLDHRRESELIPDKYIADLVICALRMANTNPGRVIPLESTVVLRLENKNQVKLT